MSMDNESESEPESGSDNVIVKYPATAEGRKTRTTRNKEVAAVVNQLTK